MQLRARWQLVSQLVLAGVAISAGIVIDSIVNPFGSSPIQIGGWLVINIGQQSLDIGLIAVTTLWIVGMINSVNFIDGLDGLLAGVATIAAATLGVIALLSVPIAAGRGVDVRPAGRFAARLPAVELPPGARVHRHRRRVHASATALAVLSVLGTAKVAVALLVLGVPIIDTFWIIIRRVWPRAGRRSAPTAATSTTVCSTWA